MRCVALIALLLLTAGCAPRGATASGARPSLGVLVQATTGRCTTVLVGTTPRRVCVPRGKTAGEPGTAAGDTAAAPADSARVTR